MSKLQTYRITANSVGQCTAVKIDDEYVRLAEHNRIVDALAADNAGMKQAIKDIVYSAEEAEYNGYFSFVVNPDAVHAAADLLDGETSATDAVIADIRAKELEDAAKEIQAQTWSECEAEGIVAAIDALEIMANWVRSGKGEV